MQTHETYIQQVAAMIIGNMNEADRAKAERVKLVYGAGANGLRGITYYDRWLTKDGPNARPFVEICAFGQRDWVQLAGTTLHELAHVVAGHQAGHSVAWKDVCNRLGLRLAKAAGHSYTLASFAPALRARLYEIERPADGAPHGGSDFTRTPFGRSLKPCQAGTGTHGGKSRGKGSGSRMLKFTCGCTIVRASAGASFQAICNKCQGGFAET